MIRRYSAKGRKRKNEEHEVFREIWSEREHRSEISGTPLLYEFGPAMYFVFSHVLGKGAYPARQMVLNKVNIVLMTWEEHQRYGDGKVSPEDPDWEDWAWLFELKEELIKEYYQINQIQRWSK